MTSRRKYSPDTTSFATPLNPGEQDGHVFQEWDLPFMNRECERVPRLILHTLHGDRSMTNQDQSDIVRRSQPDTAAVQDSRDAAAQRQIHADTEVHRQQAERLKATETPEIDKKTVEQIAEDAEQRAKR